MSGYYLGLYEKSMPHKLSLREKLDIAKSTGFDFLELSIDESDEKLARLRWNSEKRRELSKDIQESGIPIGSMCLSGHRKYPMGSSDETIRRQSLDIMERAIALAGDLGIRIIQLAGYDVYYEHGSEHTRALFRENLKKSVDIAAKSGVMLAFETMETPFMDTVSKAMRFVEDINSPYLQIYPDLGNLTNAALLYGHCVSKDLKAGSGHIAALHLKETSPGNYRDVPFGTGHVEFKAGIDAVWKQGVRRFVGEFWDNGEYLAQIVHAQSFLRDFLDEMEES